MAIICDTCESILDKEKVSKCCKADVWAEMRADGYRNICKECEKDCEVM